MANKISISITMGSAEHKLFRAAAAEEGRSLSSWIQFHLKKRMELQERMEKEEDEAFDREMEATDGEGY